MLFNFRNHIEIEKNMGRNVDLGTKVIFTMIIFVLTAHVFVDFGLSENIKFFSDVILLILVIWFLIKRRYINPNISYIIILSTIWFSYLAVRTIFGWIDILYCIFALRNWFRGIIFFVICDSILRKKGIRNVLYIIKILYVIDFFVILMKYIAGGIIGDELCGIFWDNGATNVMMCLVLMVSIFENLAFENNSYFVVFVAVSSMITAGLAELKVYFFEFIIILILALLIMCIEWNKKRQKKYILRVLMWIPVFAAALIIGMFVLSKTYPESLNVISSIEGYIKYEETSRAAYKISRVHAFSEINDMFFLNEAKYNLFGFGFGTTFAINTHLFYACHQKLYFEGGIINYLLFNAIIIGIGIKNFVVIIKGKYDTVYNKISLVMAIICVILTIYDSSMYKEISYVIYFVLACGDISTKESLEKDLINEQGTATVFKSAEEHPASGCTD